MRSPYLDRRSGRTDTSTAVLIELPQIKPGQLLLVRDYSVDNESGENVSVSAGVISMGEFRVLDFNVGMLATGQGFGYLHHFWIREGEKFALQITGSAKSGPVYVSVSGWLYDDSPEVVAVIEQKPPAGA